MNMRSSIVFFALVVLTVVFLAGAKEPQAGDYVSVGVGDGVSYEGNITYIGNGLICFDNASMTDVQPVNTEGNITYVVNQEYLTNFCISTAKIILLIFK